MSRLLRWAGIALLLVLLGSGGVLAQDKPFPTVCVPGTATLIGCVSPDGTTIANTAGAISIPNTTAAATAWTPVLTCATGSVSTYSTQVGFYNRSNSIVTAHFFFTVSNLGTCSGQVTITGLPFTSNSTTNWRGDGTLSVYAGIAAGVGYTQIGLLVLPNTSTIVTSAQGTGATSPAQINLTAAMLTTPSFEGFVTYSQ